jgi:hypothetical protein
MLTVGKHIQVLIETPASMAAREENPRKRKRYSLSCTCNGRRQENGHCQHTLAIFENNIKRSAWPFITPEPMSSKNGATDKHPIRPRIDLERELVTLRRRVRELEAV